LAKRPGYRQRRFSRPVPETAEYIEQGSEYSAPGERFERGDDFVEGVAGSPHGFLNPLAGARRL